MGPGVPFVRGTSKKWGKHTKKVKFNGVFKFKGESGTPKEHYFISDVRNYITKINSLNSAIKCSFH